MITEFGIGFMLGFTSLGLYLIYQSFFTVEQGFVGVITNFGKAESVGSNENLKLYPSGSHLKWPWGKVYQISVMEQIFDLHETGSKTALAFDGTTLQLDAKLRFRPNPKNIYDYFFRLKDPHDHIKGLFTSLLRYQIASFKSQEANDQLDSSYASIRKERKILNTQIDHFCRGRLKDKYGIEFKSIDLTDILPPEELDKALNAVLNAQIEAEAIYSRAEADCEQKKLAAKMGVAIEEAKARAIEIEIETLGSYLMELESMGMLDQYIQRRKTETLFDSKNVFMRSNV